MPICVAATGSRRHTTSTNSSLSAERCCAESGMDGRLARVVRGPLAQAFLGGLVVGSECGSADADQICRLLPLAAGDDIVLDAIARVQRLEALTLDRGEVHEHIFAAIVVD